MKKISVAMATYNGAKYIIQQLESIRLQTYPPDEVVICDDGSTDLTVELVSDYIASNSLNGKWKIIKNDKNLGFVNNFIHSILQTTGDIICLSDQDDIFLENKFETIYRFLDEHEDCLLVNTGFDNIDSSGNIISNIRSHRASLNDTTYYKLDFNRWLFESSFPGFAMAFTSTLRDQLYTFRDVNFYGHDQLISLIALKLGGNYKLETKLSHYRVHDNNTSGGNTIVKNYTLDSRVKQKEKELAEYKMLKQYLVDNKFNNEEVAYLNLRMEELSERIKCLKNSNLWKMVLFLIYSKYYPKKTILGDLYYILKSFLA